MTSGVGALAAEDLVLSDAWNPRWLKSRRQAQLKTAETFLVFHNFQFKDRRQESGIRFRNRVVPDGGKWFKPTFTI